MTLTELLVSQLTDPFRIGLLVVLFVTMLRTQATTGTYVPLAVGAVFVAVLLPLTTIRGATGSALYATIGLGVVANAILLAVIWLGHDLWQRRR